MSAGEVFLVVLAVFGLISIIRGIHQMKSSEQKPITPNEWSSMSEQERKEHIERWR